MTHIDAVSEFVDNTFGPSAGNADLMTIIDAADGTMFVDQGNGVSDLNLLFRLGDGNSRNSSTDIGRFGVGSKFGALTFGTHVTVMTVHNGRFHQFSVDWNEVLESKKWPKAYEGQGAPASKAPGMLKNGGTVIIVKDLHKGRQRPADKTYIKRLGLRFMPALLLGKNIHVYRATSIANAQKGLYKTELDIQKEFQQFLKKKLKRVEEKLITVNGKTASTTFGEVPDGDSTITGIHITYGGRVIKSLDKLGKDRLPSKLFGRVDLGASWKQSLSYNKTEITSDAEDLELAIYEAAKDMIARLSESEQSKITEKLAAEITNMLDSKFGRMLKNFKEGDLDSDEGIGDTTMTEGDEEFEPTGKENQSDQKRNVKKTDAGTKEGTTKTRGGLFEFDLKPGFYGKGAIPCYANLIEQSNSVTCEVFLNKDIPIVAKAMAGNPGNKPAVALLCVHAMAAYMVENPEWIERMFRGDTANAVLAMNQMRQAEAVYNQILTMVVTEKDEVPEIEPAE